MIESALRYPLAADGGRNHFLAFTGALLAAGIALRIAGTLFPNALVVVPIAAATLALLASAGICTRAFLDPAGPLPTVGSLFWGGAVASAIAVAVLAGPVALLGWTAVSYADGGPSLDSGAVIFFLLGSTIALFAFLLATYVLPVLVARTLRGGVRTALDARHFRVALAEIPYLQGWSVGFALTIVGWWTSVIGVTAPGPSGLLAIVVAGYCLLAGVRAIGSGYAAVPGVGDA